MTAPYETLSVNIAHKPYPIVIGEGVLREAGQHLAPVLRSRKVCIVTDTSVARLFLPAVFQSLEREGFTVCPSIVLPIGEHHKHLGTVQMIVEQCLGHGLDRQSTLIALGGGVVGDMTGFAASILLRGIDFVQMPTTLLAQVDSSVGGKTGVNAARGKNLIGSFHQPKIVLADTSTLKVLHPRQIKAGYAEVLKYALINQPKFFTWLEKNGSAVLEGDPDALTHAIKTSCAAKVALVEADEKEETDTRALLNLGHTFGHALEYLSGYSGRLLHGEAVSIGMKMAFEFSATLGLCPEAVSDKVATHLEEHNLMMTPPFKVKADAMLNAMRGDKKNQQGQITLILARGIGKAFVSHNTDEKVLTKYLKKAV